MASGSYIVGTAAMVRDELLGWCRELDVQYLTIFPHLPGMTQPDTLQQLDRFAHEVMPALKGAAVDGSDEADEADEPEAVAG